MSDNTIYSHQPKAEGTKIEEEEDPLRPEPGKEKDFVVENNSFAFTIGQLNKFLNPKSLAAFKAIGGTRGLAKGLRTSLTAGLSADEGNLDGQISFEEATAAGKEHDKDHTTGILRTASTGTSGSTDARPATFVDRKRVFKDNSLPSKKAKSLLRLMWEQYNDKILILLTIAAVVSLALGLYESLGVEHAPGSPPAVDWIEGVAICVAIIIVVIVGSLNDWQKERQFVKLNAKVRFKILQMSSHMTLCLFGWLTIYRKRIAKSRLFVPANPSKSMFTMFLSVMSFTWNLAT
jgi:Ca2+-transporting ATPase